jgi:uncharacterized protein DUF4262
MGSVFFALFRRYHAWHIGKRVRQRGWTGIYVGDYRTSPTWAYTIGFQVTHGAPEVVVFDLKKEAVDRLFSELFRQVTARELVIRDGETWGDAGTPGAVWRRVHPSRLDDTDEEPWLSLAQTFDAILAAPSPPEFEAFQLVLADADGHFPWEPEYDERLRPMQRELYLPRSDRGPRSPPTD